MVPAFADIRTLGRLAYSMEAQAAREFLQIMKVIADGSFGLKPSRLWAADDGAKVDLNQLGRGRHVVT
jgi:hypothetical protein